MRFIFDPKQVTCPLCNGDLRVSRVRAWDAWASWFNLRPRRCAACRTRFYMRRSGSSQ